MFSEVTAVLISFLRPEYTKECILSLRREYGKSIKILVAENGEYNQELEKFIKKNKGEYYVMPYDSGVCYARNRLVELAKTEFVLVGDDDFYYTEQAGVDKMLKFLKSRKDFCLIGGRIRESGEIKNYQGHLEIGKDFIHYKPLGDKFKKNKKSGIRYAEADITFNYFLARKDKIKKVPWDEKIKVAYEHSDWFLMIKKAGVKKVGYTPDAVVIHKPQHVSIEKIKEYKTFRNRRCDMDYFFRKHGVEYTIGFNNAKHTYKKEVKDVKNKYYTTRTIIFDGKTYNPGEIVTTTRQIPGLRPV